MLAARRELGVVIDQSAPPTADEIEYLLSPRSWPTARGLTKYPVFIRGLVSAAARRLPPELLVEQDGHPTSAGTPQSEARYGSRCEANSAVS